MIAIFEWSNSRVQSAPDQIDVFRAFSDLKYELIEGHKIVICNSSVELCILKCVTKVRSSFTPFLENYGIILSFMS